MASEDGFSYLLPVQTEKHRRAPNWTDGEMKALLYVWEEYHNELKTSKRNAKVYEKMSQRFFQLTGEQRFKEEIKMKITNMSFQFRRLKATAGECGEVSDWPYFKPIEKILSRPLENGRVASVDFQTSIPGPSSDNMAGSKSDEGMVGFMPEYTGSSDELEIKQELDSLTSDSEFSSSRPVSAKKRPGNKHLVMKKKKLQMMQAMLVQQKRSSRAIEETCREVRQALHQQNLLQIQCLQLQERMMNLLEKMVLPSPAGPMHMVQSGIKNKKPPEGL